MQDLHTILYATYKHVYHSNGFAISGKYTTDGKDYIPKTTHACLESGIYCKEHLEEMGFVKGNLIWLHAVLNFIKSSIFKSIKL